MRVQGDFKKDPNKISAEFAHVLSIQPQIAKIVWFYNALKMQDDGFRQHVAKKATMQGN